MQKQVISSLLSLFRDRLFELELKTNPEYADSSAEDVLSRTDRPVLIIHSTDDATVSYNANFLPLRRDLSAKNNIRFISVSGSGHSPQYTPDAFAYKELFFRDLKRARRQKKLETDSQKKEFIAKYDWKRMTEQNTDLWGIICAFLEEKG
jgi:pimeloyl-ACP methyl ester carboxylesterase